MATVGFGDIHAAGQEGRIATMIQTVFDLVVIGVLLAVLTTEITRRLDIPPPVPSGARTPRDDEDPG
ncbi:ion channel [Nocardia sp. X0981]